MGFSTNSAMALASILNFFMPMSMSVNPYCHYEQTLAMGQEYYIYNKEYPGRYPPSTSCTWVAKSSPGTKIILSCEVDLPSMSIGKEYFEHIPATNCAGDKLAISLSGDTNFKDSRNYCGKGSISLLTNENSLVVGLFATYNSPGGSFICTLTSIQDPDATTTPAPNVCDCGWKQGTRIVGGNNTLVNEFPSMAGLVDSTVRDIICGGSIISKRYVLSSAHCLLNVQQANLGILVGDHNISSGFDTLYAALYKVQSVQVHPNYDQESMVNDLAILRTVEDIRFSLYVGPVCLPFRYTSYDFLGQSVTALGWGQLFFTGPKPDVLQKVSLSVVSNQQCAQENTDSVITPGHICTYAQGKDTCQSDSGGPLLWMDAARRRLQLVGSISYGLGCATDRPGVNTRITSYLTWIVSKTTDANYCIK